MSDSDHEQLIEQFVRVTGSTRYLAEQYLSRNKNDLLDSIDDFYASNKPNPTSNASTSTGSSSAAQSRPGGGIRTLRDLNEDEEPQDKTNTNFFTGGEKSALQVEDPNKRDKKSERSLVDQIFQRAKEQMDMPDDRPSAQDDEDHEPVHRFTGSGFKLGDSTQPLEEIKDPNSDQPKRASKVSREITFWRQGFTVGDGPLHRYDDPRNENVLQELNRGRVPVSLLDVEFGQDVDVSVFKKTDEDWTPPKRKLGGFHGSGQRLGSPVPGEFAPSPEVSTAAASDNKVAPKPEDSGEGDSQVQIRFASGKKTAHKFNSTDSIAMVYAFVRTHPFNSSEKPFVLSHSFPVKPIDESLEVTVAEAKLKNAVIVQRWK